MVRVILWPAGAREGGVGAVLAESRVRAPAQQEAAARHLLHIFASFGYGGVPIRICDVINGLGGAFRHTVVALDGRFAAARRLAPEAAVTLRPLSLPRYNLLRGMGDRKRDVVGRRGSERLDSVGGRFIK